MKRANSLLRLVISLAGLTFFGATTHAALVDYAGVPAHAGHVAWEDANGFHQHHFHHKTHVITAGGQPDAQAGHDIGHTFSGTSTSEPDGDYDAYSVWVNRTYMVFDGSGGGAAQGGFSHGFIIEHEPFIPRYRFTGTDFSLFDTAGNSFDARQYVRDAFNTWSGLNTDDAAHLRMGLEFDEVASGASEITVSFVDHIAGAVAAWNPGARTLRFRRYDDAAATIKHAYFIGANKADIPNDADTDDLLTVALHETGHIVGLDHVNDIDDVMYTLAGMGSVIHGGGVFRDLSFDDRLGAQDLYSIPLPEPSTFVLTMFALPAVCWLRRRRLTPGA